MTIKEARDVVDAIQEWWSTWDHGKGVELDGSFTQREIEAFLVLMKAGVLDKDDE